MFKSAYLFAIAMLVSNTEGSKLRHAMMKRARSLAEESKTAAGTTGTSTYDASAIQEGSYSYSDGMYYYKYDPSTGSSENTYYGKNGNSVHMSTYD